MATMRLPKMLRKYASGREYIEVDGTTVAETLRAAADAHPELEIRLLDTDGFLRAHLSIFHEGRQVLREVQADTSVGPDDRLEVIINVAGGAGDVGTKGSWKWSRPSDGLGLEAGRELRTGNLLTRTRL